MRDIAEDLETDPAADAAARRVPDEELASDLWELQRLNAEKTGGDAAPVDR